jgi:hypothetical protein
MTELTAIRPLSDDDAAAAVSPATAAELAEMITSMPLRTGRRRAGRYSRWLRRKVAIGGFGVPVAVLGVVGVAATAAAATGVVVAVNARTVFENDPQQVLSDGGTVPKAAQVTVIPSSVHEFASATVPGYGQVQFWGARAKQDGFCFVIKLPDGSWGDYPLSLHPGGGFVDGSVPGCTSTQEHQVTAEPAVPAGQQPTADNGDLVGPTPVEEWQDDVRSSSGQKWSLNFGYVEVAGTATTVRDPATGATAPVTSDGYFLLVERQPGDDLQALSAAGHPLRPDYTYGGLLPGYKDGPTKG